MFKPLFKCFILFSVSSLTSTQLLANTFPEEKITNTASRTSTIKQAATNETQAKNQLITTTENNITSPVVISPFKAEYSIIHKSKKAGNGLRKLEKLADNLYRYSYTTDIEWLIFDDKRSEEAIITLANNRVIPTHYKYFREGTGRDKFYEWSYDINNKTAKNIKDDKTINVEFPDNIQDSLSYHLQHRINLIKNPTQQSYRYSVIKSSGDIREYVYEYVGEEELMLPYGLVKTIKLKREVTKKEKVTYAWFAPSLNYLLVRLYQSKDGTEQFEAQLTSFESDDSNANNSQK